jgi:uncharacterized DUF497 family protein
MSDAEFEWDAAKARRNLAKHQVGFEAACLIFGDVFAVERVDVGTGAAEIRYIITGMANGVLLTVVYTERGTRTRIISARKATKHEQADYYRGKTSE